MNITGELVTVGEMDEDDMPEIIGVPRIQIRTESGRIITVTGLTREEVRAAAPHFLDAVSLSLTADQGAVPEKADTQTADLFEGAKP